VVDVRDRGGVVMSHQYPLYSGRLLPKPKLAMDDRGCFETRLSRIDQPPVEVFEADCPWSFESWRTWIYEGIVENLPAPFDRAAKILCGVPTWSVTEWA
jgi:hypothetical protein